jgi:hypothetical protein
LTFQTAEWKKQSEHPMTKPIPKPIDPTELRGLALGVVAADRFPQLATIDGDQPRVRPVSPVKSDGFTIYVANLRMYHKTGEIAANPKVELCYMDAGHNQVRLTGVAESSLIARCSSKSGKTTRSCASSSAPSTTRSSSSIAFAPRKSAICKSGPSNTTKCQSHELSGAVA